MANKYSKLCIDKNKIGDWIKIWCEENLEGTFSINQVETNHRIQCTINNETKCIKIDFIKCKNGLLTITPHVGNEVDISTKIADSIYERVNNVLRASPFSNGFSIIMSKEDFEIVIELIETMENVITLNSTKQLQPGKANYYLYRFSGPSGDNITIKYYLNTNRMQIQGKPLWLFNEVVALVTENGVDQSDVVSAQLKYCDINIQPDDIYEEMEKVLGEKLYSFLSKTQKAILSTSFIFAKLDMQLEDYSSIVQPALRAFEGFTKKVFTQNGISCDGDKQIGAFFERTDKMAPFTMKSEYINKLNSETVKKLTSMYNYYYKNRHPYSHASAYDFNTVIISDRKVADELFNNIINSMKTWHESIVS